MKKKVAFFIKSLGIGGTERVLIAYLRGLIAENRYDIELIINRNCDVNVLVQDVPKEVTVKYILSKDFDSFLEEVSIKRKKNLFYRVIYSIMMPLAKKYREKKVEKLIKADKIDILVDFERSFVKCAEKFSCKKVLWNHFTFDKLSTEGKEKWIKNLEKYDAVVAISNEMFDEIRGFYPKSEKLFMLYNPQSFDKIINGSEIKNNLSKDELDLLNDNYITYVGRVEKIKGLEDLIDAYAKIKNEITEKLYIIGTGNETESLKNYVDELELNDRILFLGNKPNPYIWMKNAKLFVTTTYGEGLPTTYIESMICGTPVLSYDSPTGPKDILGMGKYGCLVKMGDKEHFAMELKNLLEKKENIEIYKESMKEKLKEFKIESITKKFEDMIERI